MAATFLQIIPRLSLGDLDVEGIKLVVLPSEVGDFNDFGGEYPPFFPTDMLIITGTLGE
jgi:hypothetical protein